MTSERDALAELVAAEAARDYSYASYWRMHHAWAAARAVLAAPAPDLSMPNAWPGLAAAPEQGEPRHLTRDEQQMLGRALRASAREVTAQGEPQPVAWHYEDHDGYMILKDRDDENYPNSKPLYSADAIAALRAENEQQAREISRVKLQLTSEITSALAERDALRLANIDAANLLAECSDMSVDIEKYRNEIAELKSERDAAQRAGVTTANYWMERAELAEDQRERTRDVWATRAERAEAECEKLREVVKAADAIRHCPSGSAYDDARHSYDAARAGEGE